MTCLGMKSINVPSHDEGQSICASSHISTQQFRALVCLFALDLEATKVATHTGLKRNTVSRYIMAIRQRIVRACQQEMEVDESYFGLCRVKGQRGQGTRIKTNALGIFKRNGKV